MTDPKQQAKEATGRRAAEYVVDGMRVGLGTGSTVHFTIVALGERKPAITCVATSEQTHRWPPTSVCASSPRMRSARSTSPSTAPTRSTALST